MNSETHNETATMATMQPYILSLLHSQDLTVNFGRGVCNIIECELKSFLVLVSHQLHKHLSKSGRTCAKREDILLALRNIYTNTHVYENVRGMPSKTYLPLCFAKRIITDMHPDIKLTKRSIEYVRFVAETYLKQLFELMLPSLDKTLEIEDIDCSLNKMKRYYYHD